MEMEKKKTVSVHWFRHGLRLHDNPALLESLKNADEFYAVFIFDGAVAGMNFMELADCYSSQCYTVNFTK